MRDLLVVHADYGQVEPGLSRIPFSMRCRDGT